MTYEVQPGPPQGGRFPAGRGHGGRLSLWGPALALAIIQVVGSSVAGRHQTVRVELDRLGCLLLLAGPGLLLLRRRRPVVVAAGTAVVTLLYTVLGYPYGPVFASLVVAFFSAVAAGHRRAVLIVAGCTFAGHALVGEWLYRWLPPSGDGRTSWTELSGAAAWLLAVLAGAELFRVRREQIAKERQARAEADRRRVDEERMRIARELHDVLAHSISLINVQAGVALALIDERPEQARTALTTIKAASKEALGEVRQVLSTLRAPGEAPRAPAPGLDRLPELLEQATTAGLRAEAVVEGARVPLPPGADLAAFRIVQEALTNIVRHSGSRTARVRLGYLPGCVEVQVDDDGPAVGGGESGGNGLVGMRERAAALGGTVEAGPRPDGGFRVRARLPLGAPRPPVRPDGTAPPSGQAQGPRATPGSAAGDGACDAAEAASDPAQPEPGSDARPEPGPPAGPGAGSASGCGSGSAPEPGVGSDVQPGAGAGAGAGAEPGAGAQPVPEPGAGAQPVPEPGAGAQPVPEPGSDARPEPGPPAGPGARPASGSAPGPNVGFDVQPGSGTGTTAGSGRCVATFGPCSAVSGGQGGRGQGGTDRAAGMPAAGERS